MRRPHSPERLEGALALLGAGAVFAWSMTMIWALLVVHG